MRDVTFAEDRSLVRTAGIPHVLATLRALAISLARLDGATSIATACRRYGAPPKAAIALLLHPPHNDMVLHELVQVLDTSHCR